MISIIVPNYNHEKFLPQRMESIFSQSFQDFEVILLDDCSTDSSWEYLSQFANHPKVSHCIRNEVNSGSPFKQWKKGLELAKYDWIWIAESDDYSGLTFLESMLENQNPEVSLIFSNSNFINVNGELIDNSIILEEMSDFEMPSDFTFSSGVEFITQFLSKRNFIFNASSVLFKKPKSIPNQIQQMRYTGDWYFWIYLASKGNVSYLPQKLNFFRFHDFSTRRFKGNKFELIRCQENMDCFSYSFSFFTLKQWLSLDLSYYDQFIGKYFKYVYRTGRVKWKSIFPKLPLVFLPRYYKYYLKSFFS